MMIEFVQIGGNVFIGEFDKVERKIKNPRMVIMQQVKTGQVAMMLGPLISEPKEIFVYEALYSYEVKDEKIIKMYIESVTGLVIPSGGVS